MAVIVSQQAVCDQADRFHKVFLTAHLWTNAPSYTLVNINFDTAVVRLGKLLADLRQSVLRTRNTTLQIWFGWEDAFLQCVHRNVLGVKVIKIFGFPQLHPP